MDVVSVAGAAAPSIKLASYFGFRKQKTLANEVGKGLLLVTHPARIVEPTRCILYARLHHHKTSTNQSSCASLCRNPSRDSKGGLHFQLIKKKAFLRLRRKKAISESQAHP